MSDNSVDETSDIEKKKEYSKFIVKVLMVAAVLIGLYYLMSPYQNCMRSKDSAHFCIKNTNW